MCHNEGTPPLRQKLRAGAVIGGEGDDFAQHVVRKAADVIAIHTLQAVVASGSHLMGRLGSTYVAGARDSRVSALLFQRLFFNLFLKTRSFWWVAVTAMLGSSRQTSMDCPTYYYFLRGFEARALRA